MSWYIAPTYTHPSPLPFIFLFTPRIKDESNRGGRQEEEREGKRERSRHRRRPRPPPRRRPSSLDRRARLFAVLCGRRGERLLNPAWTRLAWAGRRTGKLAVALARSAVASTPTPCETMRMEKSSGAAVGGSAPRPQLPPHLEELSLEGKKPVKNPFVPIGALVTAGVLTAGLVSFRYGNSRLGQKLMRARVVAQGVTVALMVGSAYYYGDEIKLFKKESSP